MKNPGERNLLGKYYFNAPSTCPPIDSSDLLRDVFPPDGSNLIDHDLRFGLEAIFATGRDRHTKQRRVHQARRNGADDDAGVSRIKDRPPRHRGLFPTVASARLRQKTFRPQWSRHLLRATGGELRRLGHRALPGPDNPPRRG